MIFCFIADGRTPTPKIWMRYLLDAGHEVHLISTYPCDSADPPVTSLHVVPLDFSARVRAVDVGKSQGGLTSHGNPVFARLRGGKVWKGLVEIRDAAMPLAIALQRARVRRLVEEIRPDIVHAMRIPFEGILAAQALKDSSVPLLISVWGNDFTLYAAQSKMIAALTREAMRRADGLHPDCRRDLSLAHQYGYSPTKPAEVLPGYGGIATDLFHPGPPDAALAARWGIPPGASVVLNPRGVKPYIRVDTFMQSIPLVLAENPNVVFLGGMMEGNAYAEKWIADLKIGHAIRPLPLIPHSEMAALFRLADVIVSPSEHDGTPNSLLEGIACGAFPVAGGIESVREWIEDGRNGLLCDQSSPQSLSLAVLRALGDSTLRRSASEYNLRMIRERADFHRLMQRAEGLYSAVISSRGSAKAATTPLTRPPSAHGEQHSRTE